MSWKSKSAWREERRKTVAANLLGGLTYRQMAEALGVSLGTIANDVRIIINRWQREQVKDIDRYVQIELQRIDRALNAIWDEVLAGNVAAIDRFIKLSERRAKLRGMDAPSRHELTGKDGGPIPICRAEELSDDELAAIAARGGKGAAEQA